MSALRVVFPQWQGGETNNICSYCPELERSDATTGYVLGSQLLNFLAPKTDKQITIPVEMNVDDVATENGIFARQVLLRQHKKAIEMINEANPVRIVTLGGECSVSVVPFKYLINKHPDDYAVVWIDAHPDMGEPGDAYTGYHAMALALVCGKGDKEFIEAAPGVADPKRAIIVGLRPDPNNPAIPRSEGYGLRSISVEAYRQDKESVIKFLESIKAKHVVIHLDLDVIDPTDLIAAVGKDPNGLFTKEVIEIINGIHEKFDIVGLTVAEHMPSVELRIRNLLMQLPHIGK
ncbi:arginase family protein [Histomonas meleagridis]|uniref:arginase family protein n=1 Tax=Histomonas meleagridis TaxID=135588 RepID=UPI003559654B|nr:arginase family protein [Histomonas meleagridis]KAH0796837.1 arginase family protein [Histomonas meleagridis]